MTEKATPVFGCSQPNIGMRSSLRYESMGEPRGSKVVSHAARRLRLAMVTNLRRLIAREYPGKAVSAAYELIGEATGISLSSMQRVMSGRTGPSIDTLADLARHLGASVAEILTVETEGTQSAGNGPFKSDAAKESIQAKRA